MEERIHHPNPSLLPPPPPPFTTTTDNKEVTTHHQKELSFNVYVIQYPKEQIYRVPPAENATFVENHNKTLAIQKKSRGGGLCTPKLRWTILALVVLVLISIVIGVVCKLTLNPDNPEIVVKQLTVKQDGNVKSHPVTYRVDLEVTNPNKASRVEFLDGTASLAFKGDVIAKGSSPEVEQDAKGVDLEEVILKGHQKSLNSDGGGGDENDYDENVTRMSKKEEVVVMRDVVKKRKKSKVAAVRDMVKKRIKSKTAKVAALRDVMKKRKNNKAAKVADVVKKRKKNKAVTVADVVKKRKRNKAAKVALVRNVVKRRKKNKGPLAFTLEMKMLLKKKTWLTTKKGMVHAKCSFVVSSLGSNVQVRSQNCVYV